MAKRVVPVECRWCNEVECPVADLRCEARGSERMVEIVCPFCRRLVLAATQAWRALALQGLGARRLTGPVPFELPEPHDGSAVSWDEFLDFTSRSSTDCPQAELADPGLTRSTEPAHLLQSAERRGTHQGAARGHA